MNESSRMNNCQLRDQSLDPGRSSNPTKPNIVHIGLGNKHSPPENHLDDVFKDGQNGLKQDEHEFHNVNNEVLKSPCPSSD